jgi:ABC-type thiamine transport system ATPase subunit
MMGSRLAAAGLLLATFAVGAVAGGVGITTAEHRGAAATKHSHGRAGFLTRLTEQLDLNQSQRDSICSILERHKPMMDSMWQEVRPRFDSVRTEMRNEIKAQLTPQQQRLYDELRERKAQENKNRRCQ